MLAPSIAPDYQATVSAIIRAVFGNPANAPGDPAKVAKLIVDLTRENEPPVRLLLGADSVRRAAAAATERAAEDARWQSLSISTDYDTRA